MISRLSVRLCAVFGSLCLLLSACQSLTPTDQPDPMPSLVSQYATTDFLGAPWGSSQLQAQKVLQQRKGFKAEPLDAVQRQWIKEHEAPGYAEAVFTGTVAGHFARIRCVFRNDALHEGIVDFCDENRPSFTKLKQYSSQWKNKEYILSLYDEIKEVLRGKYGAPLQESNPDARAHFIDESSPLMAHVAATWSLTGTAEGDAISIKCEGLSPYYIAREQELKDTGRVIVTHSNTGLLKRLLKRKPPNTSNDL